MKLKSFEFYCTCEKCHSARAIVDTSKILTSYPPKYSYTCPDCNYFGYIGTSEVTGGKEIEREISTPSQEASPSLSPFIDDLEIPITPNYITSPELSEKEKEALLLRLKNTPQTFIPNHNQIVIEDDFLKCLKLAYLCGVNDVGALERGVITKEEYNFMEEIFSKISKGEI